MIIRKSLVKDAAEIHELFTETTVTRDQKEPGLVEIAIPSKEKIEHQIATYQHLYSAVEETVVGFFSLYNSRELCENPEDHDEIKQYLIETKERPFYYAEFCMVARSHRRKYIAEKLMRQAHARINTEIYGAVAHAPVNNKPSGLMLQKLGYTLIEQKEFFNGLTFGIYKKSC